MAYRLAVNDTKGVTPAGLCTQKICLNIHALVEESMNLTVDLMKLSYDLKANSMISEDLCSY